MLTTVGKLSQHTTDGGLANTNGCRNFHLSLVEPTQPQNGRFLVAAGAGVFGLRYSLRDGFAPLSGAGA